MPVNPAAPQPSSRDERISDRLAALERKVGNLESFINGGSSGHLPVVSVLPAAGRAGRQVFLTSDSKLYVDTGTVWAPQT
jgi:hypothetical protein